MAIKWKFDGNYSFKDEEFARIYRFYVIETPVSGVSARAKSFKFRQINMNSLNASLRRDTPFLKDKWFVKSAKEVEGSCKDNGIDENVRFANGFIQRIESSVPEKPIPCFTQLDVLLHMDHLLFISIKNKPTMF